MAPKKRISEFTTIIKSRNLSAVEKYLKTHSRATVMKANKLGRNALYDATFTGDIDIVQLLIDYGFDPAYTDKLAGDTLLHIAAAEGHLALVDQLVGYGLDINALNKKGHNPLYYALLWVVPDDEKPDVINKDNLAVALYLIGNGAKFQDSMQGLSAAIACLEQQLIFEIHKITDTKNTADLGYMKSYVKFLIDDMNSYNSLWINHVNK